MPATPEASAARRSVAASVDEPRVARSTLLVLAVAAAIPLLLALPFLSEPFDRDESAYAVIGRGLLEGRLPYRDLWDHKPPLVYGWYAAAFAAFGERVEAPRLLAALHGSATALIVYAAGRLTLSRRAGMIAALAFAASAGAVRLQASANTEIFMLAPMTAALAAAVLGLDRRSPAWLATAGALAAIGVLTKPVALLPAAALGLALVALSARQRWPALARAAAYPAGGALALAIVLLPFVAGGALGDALHANVTYNWLYLRNDDGRDALSLLPLMLRATAPLIGGAVIGLAALATRPPTPAAVLLLAWAAGSVVAMFSVGRSAAHYWVQMLPALALLTGAGVDALLALARRTAPRAIATAAALLFAPLVLLALATNGGVFLEPTMEARHRARFAPLADRQLAAPELGAVVAGVTRPGDRVYEFGRESGVYFYARRSPAVRYFYDRPFFLDPATFGETMQALRADPPAAIVDTASRESALTSAGLTEAVEGRYYPPALAGLLRERYRLIGETRLGRVFLLDDHEHASGRARPSRPG